MEYNTELIVILGKQIAEEFKHTITGQSKGKPPLPLREVETAMRELFRQVGAEALGQYLSSQSSVPGPTITCPCGGELHYQRQREASLLSVFGRVTYRRGYYAGGLCGHGRAPLDEQWGLKPGEVSPGLAEWLALAGIELAFDQSRCWLEKYLLFSVSENTIRAATQERGAYQQERESAFQQSSQQEKWLQERLPSVDAVPQRLYGSIDAAKVRIEPRHPQQTLTPEEAWWDMKVSCWYELEAVPAVQRSTRQQEKYEREQQVYRAKNLRYTWDIAEAKAFGQLLWATGCQVKADLVPELVFVGDGAPWIWNLVSQYYPKAVQIVDWYHAVEHLKGVALVAFSQPSAREAWLEETTQALWNGQVPDVIQTCQLLAKTCEKAQQTVTYFFNNAERMQYAKFRAAGYAIGSGTVESACKQIITQRLKKSGAQWTVQGAVLTAKARAAWLSGEWEALANPYPQLPLAI